MPNITSASITLRATKGSPLTNTEVDNNFSNLNTALATGLTAASYTAADVLTKLNTVTGPTAASGLNSDTLTFNSGARSATNANTVNSIVARDASGNFSAGTITANLTGIASIAASLNYTVAIAGGGTGSTTQAGAQTNLGLVPGTNVQSYSATLGGLAAAGSAADTAPYYTGSGTASTHSFTAYMRGLAGAVSAVTARSALGLTIGTDVQAYSANLAATSSITSGLIAMTSAGAAAGRFIAAGSGISVSNGDGVGGNPTISAAVTSVQGATGAVVVSVPVTSVQGATGAVTVTNISGSAGTAHAAHTASYAHSAHTASGGWPGHLSQFANNLGNYGGFLDHCHNCGTLPDVGYGDGANGHGGQCHNCKHVGTTKQGNAQTLYHGNCMHQHNCNC